jgi:hypothetical protein
MASNAATAAITPRRRLRLADPSTTVQPTQADPVAGLIDFPLPQPVSLWPTTLLSRIAIAVLVAATITALLWFIHYRRVNRYRREALSELDRIDRAFAGQGAPNELAVQLSMLVRRTALAAFPREQIAPLSGPAWLTFLDNTYGKPEFSQGIGRLLVSAPYDGIAPTNGQLSSLVDLTRRWIRGHHV